MTTIYLDNAATTWPKPEEVYRAVDAAMREHGANPGRAAHRMSIEAQRIVDDARLTVARLFNAPGPDRVVFTLNTTDALNIALKGLIEPGHRVVTGPYEHNSVMRPLHSLAAAGAKVAAARGTAALVLDLDHFAELCRDGVDYVVMAHVSNVTGAVTPVKDVSRITHEHGGRLILDAAQSAGDLEIDMQDLGIDALAAPGHKGLYGPMGTGVLVLAADLPVEPWREGGTGVHSEREEQPAEYPWHLEAGTCNLPGIAGLRAGIRFVTSVGVTAMGEHDAMLARVAVEGLRRIDGVRVLGGPDGPRTGVVSFIVDGLDVALAAAMLDESAGIAVRSGLHCAPAAHRALGTFPTGTVRASFGHFNTREHAEALVATVRAMSESNWQFCGGVAGDAKRPQ
jgi:cysteine desulfurase family protein